MPQSESRSAGETPAAAPPPANPRSHIFRRYVLLFSALITGVLMLESVVEMYVGYRESTRIFVGTRQEQAQSAAARVEQFIVDITRQLRLISQLPAASIVERRADFQILLRQAPPLIELQWLDAAGRERLKVSRLALDVVGSGADYSRSPFVTETRSTPTYFGPVFFRKESEPHMVIAVRAEDLDQGIVAADVNLKFVYDVITQIRIGRSGLAYAVDRAGFLVAHPDLTLVLKKTPMSRLPQVRRAIGGSSTLPSASAPTTARDLSGRRVLTAHAAIPTLGWTVFAEQPLSEAFQPVYAFLVRTMALLLAGIGIAVLASTLLARRMARPIQALQSGAARIGSGDLDYRVDVHTGDEIELVATQFNAMAAALKRHIDEVQRISRLKRYLSPQIAETIIRDEEATLFKSHRREVTVVFLDLRGFTAFSEEAEPEEVIQLLRDYHAEMGRLIFHYGGTLEHFAGDGIMVFFNDPVPFDDHTQRAVRMTVEMRERITDLRRAWLADGHDLHLGVGIAVGHATLGTIGFEGRMDYGAVGSVTNLAARLSAAAAGGQILIEQKGYSRVVMLVDAEPIPGTQLKGFFRPVNVYDILGLKQRLSEGHPATQGSS